MLNIKKALIKEIRVLILIILLPISAAYASALRPPVGHVEKGRIEEAQAEAVLLQKLTQNGIGVEDHRFVISRAYEGISRIEEKIITPEQFRLAVMRVKKILSEYADFDVEYHDFVFVPGEGKRIFLRSLSDINLFSAGARKSKTIDMGAKFAIESILRQAGIFPEKAALAGKPIVRYSGEFKSDAQDKSRGAIQINGNLAYTVTFNFTTGTKTVEARGEFQKLEGRKIKYNIEDTYKDTVAKDIIDMAMRSALVPGEQRVARKDKVFFKKGFGWIERIINPAKSAI